MKRKKYAYLWLRYHCRRLRLYRRHPICYEYYCYPIPEVYKYNPANLTWEDRDEAGYFLFGVMAIPTIIEEGNIGFQKTRSLKIKY